MSLRVAVVGVGMMGRNHARILADLPEAELAGVADAAAPAVTAVAAKYRCPAYTAHQPLLDEQRPDAVVVAVPTAAHLEVATAAIRRGMHVLVEKPIAYTVAEAEALIAAARAAGVRLMVGHVERFNPAVLALKARLLAGDLGRVFQIDARRQGPFPARVGDVGVVIDLAVHDVDIMRFLSGAEVVRVSAETENRIHSTHEDLLAGLLRLDDGTVGTLTINWLTPTKIRELYVTGERGMFRLDYLTQDLYFYENATTATGEWDTLRVLRGVSEGRMIRLVVAKQEPLRSEVEAFLQAVQGAAPVAVTGEDGLIALALAQDIVRAGQEHCVVQPTVRTPARPRP